MLKQFSNIETDEDFEELRAVLTNCGQSEALATLKQVIKNENSDFDNTLDLQSINCSVKATVSATNEYVYLILTPKNSGGTADLKRIKNLWKTSLSRNMQQMKQNKKPDYVFIIDLMNMRGIGNTGNANSSNRNPGDKIFLLSFSSPIIISVEDKELMAVYSYEHAQFGTDIYNPDELEYMSEEEGERLEQDRIRESGLFDNNAESIESKESEVDSDFVSEEIISNDDILNM